MHESLMDKAIRRGWLIVVGVHDNNMVSCLLYCLRTDGNLTAQYYHSDVGSSSSTIMNSNIVLSLECDEY